MDKSAKRLMVIIGVLSILLGIFSYFYKNDTLNTYFAFFIGITLIGSVFL